MITNSSTNSKYCPRIIDQDGPSGFKAGDWRSETNSGMGLQSISKTVSNNYSKYAASVREGYQEYFVSEGVVE